MDLERELAKALATEIGRELSLEKHSSIDE